MELGMTIDYQKLRLDGLYQQDQDGHLMLRVKIPAGVLSAPQAEAIATIAESFGNGILHLTCRGSIEFHWLRYEQLEQIFRRLAAVGLSSRGACGGAVRGISCSTTFNPGFAIVQALARRINRHFAGNPHFEGLPKKFKVSVDAGYASSRHLIQDVGLVHIGAEEGIACFDVWCAGGLGREPQAGFLLERAIPEYQIIPLIEATVQVYRDHTPPPKRLKYLVKLIGEDAFRELLTKVWAGRQVDTPGHTLDGALTSAEGTAFEIPVFAGELPAGELRTIAMIAKTHADGCLALTTDQNIVLFLPSEQSPEELRTILKKSGILLNRPEHQINFRICPGNHECRMGIAATRDVARAVIDEINRTISDTSCGLAWAISGCSNSCSQPQLADVGIVTCKAQKTADGGREPRFDLYRRTAEGLGTRFAESLTTTELLVAVHDLP
jgi:sulfite reductase (ferredoxin)